MCLVTISIVDAACNIMYVHLPAYELDFEEFEKRPRMRRQGHNFP